MAIKTIYRFEDAKGVGPYQGAYLAGGVRKQMERAHCDEAHPTPLDEGISFRPGTMFSACDSMQQLREWFLGYFDALLSLGYVVVKIRLPESDVSFGANQVAFIPDNIFSKTVVERA